MDLELRDNPLDCFAYSDVIPTLEQEGPRSCRIVVTCDPLPVACGGERCFLRGDSNTDGKPIDISDAVYILQYLFAGAPEPPCMDAADANDDNKPIDLSDAVFVLQFLFASGPDIPPPSAECGVDPTVDELDCTSYPPCEK